MREELWTKEIKVGMMKTLSSCYITSQKGIVVEMPSNWYIIFVSSTRLIFSK